MDIPLEIRKSLLTFGCLCRWSIRDARSTCSVIVFVKINRRYRPELRGISSKLLALCSPFLGWCPWGWIQAHDEWDTSKPQENWTGHRNFVAFKNILSKDFHLKLRVKERNKFQTSSLQVCSVQCLQWVPPHYHAVKAEALGSEHWGWFFSAINPVPYCCLA